MRGSHFSEAYQTKASSAGNPALPRRELCASLFGGGLYWSVLLCGFMLIYELAVSSVESSTMKTTLGSYHLIRQAKPENRWKVPGVREFDPNWIVRFCLPGEQKRVTAKFYPICERCMAVEDLALRANCTADGCQRDVRRWAQLELAKQAKRMREGDIKASEKWLRPKQYASISEVLAVYLQRGPTDRRQRVNMLSAIYEQTTGREIERAKWEELSQKLLMTWAEMRQEAGRRGWLGLGGGKNMPDGGWAVLRAMATERKLKAVDEVTEAAWNTTIQTYLVSARSIFGEKSRLKVLRDLTVPELGDFMEPLPVDLPCPEGHQEIPAAVMAEVERRLPALMGVDGQLYAFFRACEETGVRPGTLRALNAEALAVLSAEEMSFWKSRMALDWKVDVDELCDFGGLLDIPEKKGGNAVRTPVSAEVASLLGGLGVGGGNLFGCKHKTAAREMHERLNVWLRGCGVEGNHVAYLLRHRKAQALRRFGGKSAVAVGLGHTSEAMAERYSKEDRIVPAVFSR